MIKHYRIGVIFLSMLLFLIGGMGWFRGISQPTNENIEMPLGDAEGISIDSKGNIYLSLHFYGRIQIYNSKGIFLKAWIVNADGGDFRIRTNKNDDLEVATVRNEMFFIYSLKDGLIFQSKDKNKYFQMGPKHVYTTTDNNRNTYNVKGFFFPRVETISPSGSVKTIITVPIQKWIFMGPFPAWLISAFSVAIGTYNIIKLVKEYESI